MARGQTDSSMRQPMGGTLTEWRSERSAGGWVRAWRLIVFGGLAGAASWGRLRRHFGFSTTPTFCWRSPCGFFCIPTRCSTCRGRCGRARLRCWRWRDGCCRWTGGCWRLGVSILCVAVAMLRVSSPLCAEHSWLVRWPAPLSQKAAQIFVQLARWLLFHGPLTERNTLWKSFNETSSA